MILSAQPNHHQSHARASARRGSAAVALIVALALLSLVTVSVVMSGARDSQVGMLRVQGQRAQFAADSAAHMAVKEMIDNADRDGDGTIGTISNDSNTATDPTINNGTRVWATQTVAGSTTTITARGQNADAVRAIQVVLTGTAATAPVAGTIMFVVGDSASLDAQESAKKTLMEGWGYTVVPISSTASAGTFTTALLTTSVAYVSETITSTNLNTKIKSATCGVVIEENDLADDFGFSSATTAFSATAIDVINTSHYITSGFASGSLTIATSNIRLMYVSGTLGTHTKLCEQLASANGMLAVMERGDALYGGGTASGRRVLLPWRGSSGSFDINNLNASGQTIMKRSIEWALMPVAWYKLDDASGSTALDSVAGRNGTLVGPTWTTGTNAGGLQFDGSNDYVSIADAPAFKPTNALTVAGWVKGTGAWGTGSEVDPILRKGDSNPNNWQLCISEGKVELILDTNDNSGFYGNTVLALNTWYHVAATWDGVNGRVYLNGVLDNTPTARAAPIGTDTRAVYLGGRIGSTDVTTGTVDDVRFYDRCLTAAEIAALAAGGTPTITSWTQVTP